MILRLSRFPQVFKDEGGLASGEVALSFDVPSLGECFTQVMIVLNPSIEMSSSCIVG